MANPIIHLKIDGDNAWPEVLTMTGPMYQVSELHMTGLDRGMVSGKPSVMIRVDLPGDAGIVFAETSLALLLNVADALKARYGDPRDLTFKPEQPA